MRPSDPFLEDPDEILEKKGSSDPIEWRYEQFKRLRFTDEQAIVLAYSKDFKGTYVYHEDVARILERAKEKHSEEESRNIVFDLLS